MRKLAWFIIIFLIVALAIAVGCAYSPDFSSAVYSFGVDTVGAGIVTSVTGALTGLMLWGSSGLGPAVAVFAGTGIFFTVLWVLVFAKYIWPKVKSLKQPTTPPTFQGAPVYTPPTVVPAKAPEQVIEKKEEVPA